MPVRWIPSSVVAGRGSKLVLAVITSTASARKSGTEHALANAQQEREQTLWNRANEYLATEPARSSLHEFSFCQRNGTNHVQSAIARNRRLGGSNRRPSQIVHIERLLKIASAADQPGFGPARIPRERCRSFGCGPQQERSAEYRITQAGGTHQSFHLSLAAVIAVGRFLIGSRGTHQNKLLGSAPLCRFHDAASQAQHSPVDTLNPAARRELQPGG